jgi:hypothetical protein
MLDRGNQLLIVYPDNGNVFYFDLAQRLLSACLENSREAAVYSASVICEMAPKQLREATLAILNPYECTLTSNRSRFVSNLKCAHKRLIVLPAAAETVWHTQQFELPIDFEALIDVGFVSQKEKHQIPEVPYHFLFFGPTREEEWAIAALTPSKRPIPWALVGHRTTERIKLARQLIENLDPGGFVFLPNFRLVRKGEGMLSSSGLATVLSRTEYYVWISQHSFPYYESFRFREALLAGAVPCKIDSEHYNKYTGIPGTFASVESFCSAARNEDYWSMFCSARNFYLSRGSLAWHLEKVLQVV